ncbi:putative pre-mRNA splicing factor ATP-dependent RNA helicase [Trypanosoma rangeli]|uniref:Putative pre-mRNA splicing factor ATP-dependent RNA helicase n=1 Tax=Trypanosoma rangeli TaxID=5698 RepID=A0A3R7KBN8_TRYRA|nr:putative pre-mRNA splicing factor ATP-dependent RNA helicase [Trypanosoma rangeli]RNF04926.1 putative pre-mRNA splicing factor ATP-dependent RNA helicase [Trypanosoma rangeli]|eukprot:RNF04926.1 putative pre-mRNA splicing factor ATP-dependent RNA helicase [Trypanosoma rangeli]
MAERFRVHLAPLDVNLMTGEKNGEVAPLVHVEAHMQERGDALYDEAEMREEGRGTKFSALLTRLYYGAATIVSKIEEVPTLVRSCPMASGNTRPSLAHIQLQNDGRLFLQRPVEDGDYMLAVTVPAGVWRWLGPMTLQIILATAVRGYEIATSVAAVSSVPTYCPLRDRLAESAEAVGDAVQIRMQQLMEFVALLNECEHHETASSAALLHGGQEVVAVTQRLCHNRPSLMRSDSRLTGTLQQLLWSATSYADYASLSGAVSCGGMCNGYKRLVVTAAAVWYHGEPLFISGSGGDFEAYLLPAAIVAYAGRCLADREATVMQNPISVRCLAMHRQTSRYAPLGVGYVRQHEDAKERTAAVTAAFVSVGGWIITLHMEAALNDFTGAPMPHIVSGVTDLITRTLETPRFAALVRLLTSEQLMTRGQSTNTATSPAPTAAAAAMTVSSACILRAVRHIGLFAHLFVDASDTATLSRDICLYRYHQTALSAVVGNEWGLWPKHTQEAVQRLVEVSALTLRRQCRKVCGSVDRLATFSLLRGRRFVVVLLAVPVYSPVPKAVFLLVELEPEGIPAATELRAFATWVLTKVL